MTKFSRTSTGKYSVQGKSYDHLIGTRAQVWHGTAYKTTGGLTHSHLMKNKTGRIVSKTKHNSAKREKRLIKAGFFTKKGHFGFVKKTRGGATTPSTNAMSSTPMSTTPMSTTPSSTSGTSSTNTMMPSSVPKMTATSNNVTMKTGGRRKKRGGTRMHRGGSGVGYALSPSPFNGKGVMTSGNAVQFAAGNA